MKRKHLDILTPDQAYEWMTKYATRDQLSELFHWSRHRNQLIISLNKSDVVNKPGFVEKVRRWYDEYQTNHLDRIQLMQLYSARRKAWLMLSNEIQLHQKIQVDFLPFVFLARSLGDRNDSQYAYHKSKPVRATIVHRYFPMAKQKFHEAWIIDIVTQQSVQISHREHKKDIETWKTTDILAKTRIQLHVAIDVKRPQDYEMKGFWGQNKDIRIVWSLWQWHCSQCLQTYLPYDLILVIVDFLKHESWTTR